MELIKWMQQPCQQQQGGAPCRILVHNIMQEFKAIPLDPAQLPEFDRRLRRVYDVYEFNQSVHNETTYTNKVCDIVGKASWNDTDREELWEVVGLVCGGYP